MGGEEEIDFEGEKKDTEGVLDSVPPHGLSWTRVQNTARALTCQ